MTEVEVKEQTEKREKTRRVVTSLFSYSPITTDRRKRSHELVNQMVIEFGVLLCECIDDPAELTVVFRKLSDLRTATHSAITHLETGVAFRDLFPPRK